MRERNRLKKGNGGLGHGGGRVEEKQLYAVKKRGGELSVVQY